ncbi:fatty acid desaturase [Thiomicrorhabdus sp. 6S3-12]|uniref:fatty acid desaturase n=1 Tax=Thiomicrorhabdus sp. 6S3-12 TaxID=2819681 RepID=UPI001AAC7C35|nr:fatty acid desaturase [Thiomicrorhabdus sp. 6S3-12]MBO1923754.1 fatty acid desaturase [Thiomicrorhabdus sp. 6S3-12]
MPSTTKTFRHDDALLPTLLATGYALSGYLVGGYWMLIDGWYFNLPGVLWFAHSMVIAAYLIHEAAHQSVFRKKQANRWYGELLLWITGSSYSDFNDIVHKHNRHHSDRADIVSFDFRPILEKHPFFLKTLQILEWAYIPALEILMHTLVIILPFVKTNRRQRRLRVLSVLFVRLALFAWLASISIHFLWLYALAYLLFLTVMRFMDVHQHTYEVYETLDSPRGPEARLRDRDFEEHNTYSNLLSVKYPWINLLVLNFCYHNVHHHQQLQPWYRLPKLHQQMYGDDDQQVLTFRHLIKSFHKYRIPRILNGDPIDLPVKHDEGESFIGVDGVSFLTAH